MELLPGRFNGAFTDADDSETSSIASTDYAKSKKSSSTLGGGDGGAVDVAGIMMQLEHRYPDDAEVEVDADGGIEAKWGLPGNSSSMQANPLASGGFGFTANPARSVPAGPSGGRAAGVGSSAVSQSFKGMSTRERAGSVDRVEYALSQIRAHQSKELSRQRRHMEAIQRAVNGIATHVGVGHEVAESWEDEADAAFYGRTFGHALGIAREHIEQLHQAFGTSASALQPCVPRTCFLCRTRAPRLPPFLAILAPPSPSPPARPPPPRTYLLVCRLSP